MKMRGLYSAPVRRPAERRCYYNLSHVLYFATTTKQKNIYSNQWASCLFFFHLERTHQFNIAGEYGAHVFQKTQHTDVIKSMYTAKAIEHRDVE